eukprot:6175015-Pleurochrysis_carterae.AAC.1
MPRRSACAYSATAAPSLQSTLRLSGGHREWRANDHMTKVNAKNPCRAIVWRVWIHYDAGYLKKWYAGQ